MSSNRDGVQESSASLDRAALERSRRSLTQTLTGPVEAVGEALARDGASLSEVQGIYKHQMKGVLDSSSKSLDRLKNQAYYYKVQLYSAWAILVSVSLFIIFRRMRLLLLISYLLSSDRTGSFCNYLTVSPFLHERYCTNATYLSSLPLSQPSNLINEEHLQVDGGLFASNSFSESSELHIEKHDIGISGIPENEYNMESSQYPSSSLDDNVLNRGNQNSQDPVYRSESLEESSEVDILFTSSRPRKGIPLDESLYDAAAATATSSQGLSNSLPDGLNDFVILDVDLDGSILNQRGDINEPSTFEDISQDKSQINSDQFYNKVDDVEDPDYTSS